MLKAFGDAAVLAEGSGRGVWRWAPWSEWPSVRISQGGAPGSPVSQVNEPRNHPGACWHHRLPVLTPAATAPGRPQEPASDKPVDPGSTRTHLENVSLEPDWPPAAPGPLVCPDRVFLDMPSPSPVQKPHLDLGLDLGLLLRDLFGRHSLQSPLGEVSLEAI